jgi:hypothetical protein
MFDLILFMAGEPVATPPGLALYPVGMIWYLINEISVSIRLLTVTCLSYWSPSGYIGIRIRMFSNGNLNG